MITRLFTTSLMFLIAFISLAQEQAMEETAADAGRQSWSDESKWVLLAVFTIVVIIIALRTFRGKADA